MRIWKHYKIMLGIIVNVLLCLSAFSVSVMAKGETVRVAVIDYPNYLEMDETGNISGYAYEYLEEIAQYTGWNYEFEQMTFSEAMTALANGQIDLLPGNQYTEERAKLVDFSEQSMGDGGSVLCIRSSDSRYCYNDYGSYEGLKIAALAGSVRMEQAKEKLAEYGVTADFMEYDSDDAAKQALDDGDVDAVLMSNIRCESKYKILARLSSADLYFCTNHSRPYLKTELDSAMEEIRLNNPYYEERLNEKYYGDISIQLAFTHEEKEYIQNAGPILVAVSEDMTPIEYYNEKAGQFCGIVPDILNLISTNSGLEFQCVRRGSKEDTRKQLDSGEITLLASVADRSDLAEQWNVTLTDSYRSNSVCIIIRNSDIDYQKPDCTVVLKEGYPYLEMVARAEGYNQFIYTNNFRDCLKKVHDKTADMTFIPSNSSEILLSEKNYENLSEYLLAASDMDFSMGISKTADPMLLSVLNKAIASITNEERNALLIENLNAVNDSMSAHKFFQTHRTGVLMTAIVFVLAVFLLMFALATSRKRTNQRLEAALQQADAANAAKTDFLSRMSHDIRTPMNAIIGLTKLAQDEEMSANARMYLGNIDSSSEFLLGLINDILDLSKIESGELKLKPEPYHLEEFRQSVNTVIKPLMDAKQITFLFDISEINECLMLDKLRFNQIFFNLLSNAAKFTPAGGKVEFTAEKISEKDGLAGLRYYVKDTGIGISEEFLPHLFEAFSQEQTKENEVQKGTGLGLPIVKSLVQAMNGTITVKSELGKGTEFAIEIHAPISANVKQESSRMENMENLNGAQILLVEDNDLNILVAQKLLEKVGCIVTVAKNGQEAVEKLCQSENAYFQAILMDIRMPVMDGLTAARTIRSLDRADAKSVPIIAMTADAFAEEKKKTADAGMDYHLSKPINPSQMYQVLAQFVK